MLWIFLFVLTLSLLVLIIGLLYPSETWTFSVPDLIISLLILLLPVLCSDHLSKGFTPL